MLEHIFDPAYHYLKPNGARYRRRRVGSNRRYAEQIDRRVGIRIDEVIMRDEPETLTPRELDLGVQPLTRTPVPLAAQAWVRYGAVAIRVDCEIVAWTPVAVAVRWSTPSGVGHRAWVWGNAVTRV